MGRQAAKICAGQHREARRVGYRYQANCRKTRDGASIGFGMLASAQKKPVSHREGQAETVGLAGGSLFS